MTDSDCALDHPRRIGEVVWCATDPAHRERHANAGVQGKERERERESTMATNLAIN